MYDTTTKHSIKNNELKSKDLNDNTNQYSKQDNENRKKSDINFN